MHNHHDKHVAFHDDLSKVAPHDVAPEGVFGEVSAANRKDELLIGVDTKKRLLCGVRRTAHGRMRESARVNVTFIESVTPHVRGTKICDEPRATP